MLTTQACDDLALLLEALRTQYLRPDESQAYDRLRLLLADEEWDARLRADRRADYRLKIAASDIQAGDVMP